MGWKENPSANHGRFGVQASVSTGIAEGRNETGIQPYRIAPKVRNIIELLDNAGNITDPVAIGLTEGLRINLVENSAAKPAGVGRLMMEPRC